MNTVAAVDCGTNSIRLLVSGILETGEAEETVELIDLERRMEVVRLGQGVDRTGRFAPEALERTFAALREYAEVMEGHGVPLGTGAVRMVATSATRDVANRDEFIAGVEAVLGVAPEVVTGEEEAELSFVGATVELAHGDEDGFPRPFLVVDIGGGSTEFVVGHTEEDVAEDGGVVRAARSVDIGCVRMAERHFHADPPTAEQVAAARADIDAALEEAAAAVPLEEAETVVCVAGTATTVAGIALDLPAYDPQRIHCSRVGLEQVRAIAERLLAMPREERAAIGVMHPGRVDVIAAGALILERVLARAGAPGFVASEQDILDGIVWDLVLREE